MTKLPAITYQKAVEADALDHARECLRRAGEGNFLNLDCSLLDPEAGHRYVRRLMKETASRDDALGANLLLHLAEFARLGWDDAHQALVEMILEYTNRGEKMPVFLASYNGEIAKAELDGRRVNRSSSGPQKATNFFADMAIVGLIMDLISPPFFLKATRSSRKHHSAASIVAQAMTEIGLHRGGEGAVNDIWKMYKPVVLPGFTYPPVKVLKRLTG